MNVLIINSILYTPQGSGVNKMESIKDTMIYNLALAFQKNGHKITVVAAEDYKPIVDDDYPFDIIYLKSNLPKVFMPSVLPLHIGLIHYLREKHDEYDLIISSEVFSFNSLFSSLIASKKTVIWHELGAHNRKMKEIPSKVWYNVIARFLMKRALIMPRSIRAGMFVKQFGLKVANGFIDNGINSHKLIPNKNKKKQFVVIAQLIPRKNVISIIQKFSNFLVKYNLKDYILYIAGDGPVRNEIIEYIKTNNLENNVILLGKIPHDKLNQYLSESCGMLCNTKVDLNMIAISESIYVGTPIITNMIPYSSDVVKEFKLGIAKDEWNEDDIYELITNNSFYVDNCISYSPSLSLDATVNNFISILNNENSDNK